VGGAKSREKVGTSARDQGWPGKSSAGESRPHDTFSCKKRCPRTTLHLHAARVGENITLYLQAAVSLPILSPPGEEANALSIAYMLTFTVSTSKGGVQLRAD
jgi:hypothetical protein